MGLELCTEDGTELPEWTAGAHIDLEIADHIVRQYSLCGSPADKYRWRIAVLREHPSRGGSELIHDKFEVGHVVSVNGPRNNFELVDVPRYIFIAGGIGITPILPMVHEVAARGKPWTLVYGGRTRGSMAFVDELRGLRGGDLHVIPQDEHGLLDLKHFLGNPQADTAVYCCGPEPLLDAVEGRCTTWPSGALHLERFAPRPVSRVRSDGEFEVRLAQSGKTLCVPANRELLDVLEDAGLTIDNSCRAGICGTCEVRVVEGVPEHRDDILSEEERSSNEIILPCVSRSRSPVLVLDL
ncbi:PDR/VanB family oxidoreductase [Rhodococcus pyridinivorans]